MRIRGDRNSVLVATSLVTIMIGCAGPLYRSTEEQLRESLISSHAAQLQAAASSPIIKLTRKPSIVEADITAERRRELDEISGMAAYDQQTFNLAQDVLSIDQTKVSRLNLQEAIAVAVKNNLDLQIARLAPAMIQTRITQAEAVFDALFFTQADYSKLDTPQPSGFIPGLVGNTQSEDLNLSTGIRKDLTSGGRITFQTNAERRHSVPSIFAVNTLYNADLLVTLEQPLLRGFGADVNRANIVLGENAHRTERENLRQNMIDLVAQVEEAYWNLFFAQHQVLVLSRRLDRTTRDRSRLKPRIKVDVKPATLTEVSARVEQQRADLVRAGQQIYLATDALKRLLNSRNLPLADETLIRPDDQPVEAPLSFSLLDAITTALRHRPEMNAALLDIKDASIRQRVADNNRLPLLNVAATATTNGLGFDGADDAYSELDEFDFIDYMVSARFEWPIGNRQAEAFYAQRRLERQASVLAYQRQAQDVLQEVKDAIREVRTSYELIGATRAARRAAADSLRSLEAEQQAGAALTPEFINLKLDRQDALANTELQEVQALVDYNNAIARFYQAQGTLLDRNNITFTEDSGRPY